MPQPNKAKSQKNIKTKSKSKNVTIHILVSSVLSLVTLVLSCALLSFVMEKMPDPSIFMMPASFISMFLSGNVCAAFSRKKAENTFVFSLVSAILCLLLISLSSVFCKTSENPTPVFGVINTASFFVPAILFSFRKNKNRKKR